MQLDWQTAWLVFAIVLAIVVRQLVLHFGKKRWGGGDQASRKKRK